MTCTFGLVSALAIVQPAIIAGETKKTPIGGMAGDNFGTGAAVSGDTAVIGAGAFDVGGNMNAGAAFVYERTGGTWTQVARLTASNAAVDDMFGRFTDIDGDTIVIGAPYAGGADEGLVYVFEKPVGGWANMTETAQLSPSDGAMDDLFGYAVAMHGDTVVVGSPIHGASESGAVYLFEKPGGGWANMTENAKLTASDALQEERLGLYLDIQGDTVVAGAPNADNTGLGVFDGPGALYVFNKPPAGWINNSETAKLFAADGAETDFLGYSVCINGTTIVAGAVNDGNTGGGAQDGPGSAYVFEMPEGGWVDSAHDARLVYSNPESTGYFGYAISLFNDKILVGAINLNHSPMMQDGEGAAYLYVRPEGGWSGTLLEDEEILASDASLDRLFGYRICMNEDWFIITAPGAGPAMGETGGAYFFSLDDDNDGVANHADNCPNDSAKLDPGPCGCGVTEVDSDGDGVPNCNDTCPADATNDSDGDGVCDSADICDGGDDTIDTDGDGIPDDCDDSPAAAMTPAECCGGGMPAMMPFMLLGWKRRRRSASRK